MSCSCPTRRPRRARSCTRASTRPARWRSFTAAGTSYATHGEPMIPLYIFYSMFGFQRTGDGFWAAADQMTRGFLLGATAGRTTLNGEGLQHEDGHSHAAGGDQPGGGRPTTRRSRSRSRTSSRTACTGCTASKPENIFYYLTVYNEPLRAAGRARRRRRRGRAQGHLPVRRGARRRRRPACLDPRQRHGHAVGAQGPAAARPGLGRGRRRVVGDLVDRAAPRRHRRPRSTTCCTRAASRGCPTSRRSWPGPPARWSRSATGCGRCPT